MSQDPFTRAVAEMAHQPVALAALLSAHAEHQGRPFASGRLDENGRQDIVLALRLDDDAAERLFNLLNELTDGAIPRWADHLDEVKLLEHHQATGVKTGRA